ncbi:hypothetical protein BpHYR1_039361 [Brachionus plicatilis]|uniref:Uncharacterized protein n=1 Tax=Brachionus plicatilis TaxID=10195 RepID=A0A3M7QWZ5_BRAPC|nr:hypothetical protein BpHYR1_039361 [Brachionus plicatilis]
MLHIYKDHFLINFEKQSDHAPFFYFREFAGFKENMDQFLYRDLKIKNGGWSDLTFVNVNLPEIHLSNWHCIHKTLLQFLIKTHHTGMLKYDQFNISFRFKAFIFKY